MTLVFQAIFALCLSTTLVVGEMLRKQVNHVSRERRNPEIGIRWPRSMKETALGTHLWSFLNDLLEQHSRYYPTNPLRKVFIGALVGMPLSVICLFIFLALRGFRE